MVIRKSRSPTMLTSPQTPIAENRKSGRSELSKAWLNWSQIPNWSLQKREELDQKDLAEAVGVGAGSGIENAEVAGFSIAWIV
jgi:hypothetical protein